SPSKSALMRSIGVGASTCNYQDWLGTDVLVFWGSVASNASPVSTKYMMEAKKRGTKIIVINPYREPALEDYWIPSVTESALMENVKSQDWDELVESSGISKSDIIELSETLAKAKTGVMVWALGLTMHSHATDNISQVANVALLRGWLGKKHCGLMPLRGHSSVQGSGEMGADPFSLPGGGFDDENVERIEKLWGFDLPNWPGDTVGVTIENAMLDEDNERKLKLYYMSGGNFLET